MRQAATPDATTTRMNWNARFEKVRISMRARARFRTQTLKEQSREIHGLQVQRRMRMRRRTFPTHMMFRARWVFSRRRQRI
jgi:hypothetical protein